MARWRPALTTALGILTLLLLLFATLSTWARFDLVSQDALGRHARQALKERAVRDELAADITRRVAASDPRLAAAQPVVRRAADILIGSRQFADIVDIAMQQVRRSVLEGREVSGTRLTDIETQLRQTLEAVDPSIAARLPRNWDTGVIDLRSGAPVPRAFRAAEALARWWLVSLVVAFAATVGWIASSFNRRLAVTALGSTFGFVGAVLVLGRRLGREAVSGRVEGTGARGAVRAAYDVVTAGIFDIGVAFLVVAAVVLAATLTGSLVPTLAGHLRAGASRLAHLPRHPAGRVAWAMLAMAAGLAIALASPTIGPAVAIVAGLGVAFAGIRVLVATLPSQPLPARSRVPQLSIALAGVVVVLAVSLVTGRGGEPARGSAEKQDVLVCNGYAELCDRRLDEVTLAGTHNSMASANAGFAFAEHIGTIRQQLERGARVLLIDTYYGIPSATGLVFTDFRPEDRGELVRRYGEETVANVERLRQTVSPPTAPRSLYLCHSFCELGATTASSAFSDIRRFLAANPTEVVVIIIQDETQAEDTVRVLRSSGLADLAYEKPAGAPWPTLSELIRQGTPLVVFSQREGGDPPWFMRAFSHMQDNPFRARSIDELSCAYNRGPTDAPLFLLNHWINKQSPDRRDARQINARSFLLDQVRRCEQERGQRVNFIAVDFMEEGDVLGAVAELNLGPPR